jgi:hypothetical protein
MLGFGLWLTPEAIREHFATNWSLRFALEHTIESTFSVGPFPVESASLSDEDTANLIGDLLSAPSTLRLNGRPVETDPGSVLMIRKPVLKRGLLMLALIDHLGERPAVPVFSDASGTLHFQTPVASVLPEVPEAMMPLDGSGSPQWVVDVSLDSPQMPSGRGLHSKWVLEENEQAMTTLIRSSRAGISFLATTHGFVVNGTVIRSRLATPKIRQLGMYSWVQAMAEAEGCQVEYSRPGRFAALVASRLGSRERLIQIASGPLLPFLKEYVPGPLANDTDGAFPAHDGVELEGKNRFCTFRALKRLLPDTSWPQQRALVDELLEARLMRQGLVLGCEECAGVSFISIDELQQKFECKLCGAMNEIRLARWKSLSREPEWYYDLHRAFRSLLSANGDVVLLAADRLRSTAQNYADTAEVEFRSPSRPDLNFEIDVVAHVDGEVVVVEAKNNGSLGSGAGRTELIQKRFRAARLLHADRVQFATTANAWAAKDIKAVESIAQHEFPGISVEFVGGLTHSTEVGLPL